MNGDRPQGLRFPHVDPDVPCMDAWISGPHHLHKVVDAQTP